MQKQLLFHSRPAFKISVKLKKSRGGDRPPASYAYDRAYSVFQVGCPEEIKKWELSLFVQETTAE